jgi:anti-anti-sigma factor
MVGQSVGSRGRRVRAIPRIMRVNVISDVAKAGRLRRGSHVCWLVDEPAAYLAAARALLAEAGRLGQKPVLVGPAGSAAFDELEPAAANTADPRTAFLGEGSFDPEPVIALFRRQSGLASAEGYQGLRIVADMDWLLPEPPPAEMIAVFELLLDRLACELDMTVICAYRHSSFDTAATAAALSVHPAQSGREQEPPYRLVSGTSHTWRLAGEIDLSAGPAFAAALSAAAALGDCVVDVADLEFVDVAGMRAIATVALAAKAGMQLLGASSVLRRCWQLSGFDHAAPMVELVS